MGRHFRLRNGRNKLCRAMFLKCFSPKLRNTTKVFKNTANLKCMIMQIISDKMHFDAVALRPKNAI